MDLLKPQVTSVKTDPCLGVGSRDGGQAFKWETRKTSKHEGRGEAGAALSRGLHDPKQTPGHRFMTLGHFLRSFLTSAGGWKETHKSITGQ